MNIMKRRSGNWIDIDKLWVVVNFAPFRYKSENLYDRDMRRCVL
jgi:hypothetical protein